MWFNLKKKNTAPLPPKPSFPMPEPVKIPEISTEEQFEPELPKEEIKENIPLMEESQTLIENPVEKPQPQPKSTMEYGKLNSNVHIIKKREQIGNEEFFFLEKSNYASVRGQLNEIDALYRNSVEYIDEATNDRNTEDAVINEFRIAMEDIQKKVLFVDKTLFGA